MTYIYITVAFVLGMIFILIINYVKKSAGDKSILKSNELAKKILTDSELVAENLKKTAVLEAKEEWYKTQKTYEDEINNKQDVLEDQNMIPKVNPLLLLRKLTILTGICNSTVWVKPK